MISIKRRPSSTFGCKKRYSKNEGEKKLYVDPTTNVMTPKEEERDFAVIGRPMLEQSMGMTEQNFLVKIVKRAQDKQINELQD